MYGGERDGMLHNLYFLHNKNEETPHVYHNICYYQPPFGSDARFKGPLGPRQISSLPYTIHKTYETTRFYKIKCIGRNLINTDT